MSWIEYPCIRPKHICKRTSLYTPFKKEDAFSWQPLHMSHTCSVFFLIILSRTCWLRVVQSEMLLLGFFSECCMLWPCSEFAGISWEHGETHLDAGILRPWLCDGKFQQQTARTSVFMEVLTCTRTGLRAANGRYSYIVTLLHAWLWECCHSNWDK